MERCDVQATTATAHKNSPPKVKNNKKNVDTCEKEHDEMEKKKGDHHQSSVKSSCNDVKAGDVQDCLSDEDLDWASNGRLALPARTLHDVLRGGASGEKAGSLLRQSAAKNGLALAVIWAHHHWALLVLKQGASAPVILDSAPGPITARTFQKVCRLIGLGKPNVVCPCRQRRGSNECGLFVLLFTLLLVDTKHLHWALEETRLSTETPPPITKLEDWRKLLAEDERDPTVLLSTAKDVINLLRRPAVEPAKGGAGDELADMSATRLDSLIKAEWSKKVAPAALAGNVVTNRIAAGVVRALLLSREEEETLLFPLCADDHWSLVQVIRRGRNEFAVVHYDSLAQGGGRQAARQFCNLVGLPLPVHKVPARQVGRQCGWHVWRTCRSLASARTKAPLAAESDKTLDLTHDATSAPLTSEDSAKKLVYERLKNIGGPSFVSVPLPVTSLVRWRGAKNNDKENICFALALGAFLWSAVPKHTFTAATLIDFARVIGLNAKATTGDRRLQEDTAELLTQLWWHAPAVLRSAFEMKSTTTTVITGCNCGRNGTTTSQEAGPTWELRLRPQLGVSSLDELLKESTYCSAIASEACVRCQEARRTTETKLSPSVFQILSLPRIVDLDGFRTKDMRRVTVPRRMEIGGQWSELVSTICHSGQEFDSGHYVTYVFAGKENPTLYNDDKSTTGLSAEEVMHTISKNGVLFLYATTNKLPSDPSDQRTTQAPPAAAQRSTSQVANDEKLAKTTNKGSKLEEKAAEQSNRSQQDVQQVLGTARSKRGETTVEKRVEEPSKQLDTSPKASPLSHGAVRNLAKDFAPGTVLRVTWSNANEGGVWYGRLLRRPLPGLQATIDYVGEECHCGDVHAPPFATELPWNLPEPGISYWDIGQVDEVPPLQPECEGSECTDTDEEEEVPLCRPTEKLSRTTEKLIGSDEQQTTSPAVATSGVLRGDLLRRTVVYAMGQTPHIHNLTWRALASTTRALHQRWIHRIKAMPADLLQCPIGAAIIELVLRHKAERNWVWSTVASTLSTVCSALRALPMYAATTMTVDLRTEPSFLAAMRRAQQLARTEQRPLKAADALPVEKLREAVTNVKSPSAKILIELAWSGGLRVSDLATVRTDDVQFTGDFLRITIREGKGARWWGPFSVMIKFAKEEQSLRQRTLDLVERLGRSKLTKMFSSEDKLAVSKAIRALGAQYSVRSIRKGAIQFYSATLSERFLLELSGHKNRATLLRYLGWGALSPDKAEAASLAAKAREKGVVVAGRAPPQDQLSRMGLFSGFGGLSGRRVEKPPTLLPTKPPSWQDLALPQHTAEKTKASGNCEFPLHVKDVHPINWEALEALLADVPTRADDVVEEFRKARAYITSSPLNPDATAKSVPEAAKRLSWQVPAAKFRADQLKKLEAAGKIESVGEPTGPVPWVAGFLVAEMAKRRLRPIFEPSVNPFVVAPHLAYPSRLERRHRVKNCKYLWQFDYSAYFDQFGLSEEAKDLLYLKNIDELGKTTWWRLSRLPMGATWAPFVAQVVTDIICSFAPSKFTTMIDNVRLQADNPKEFAFLFRTFVERCTRVGITLNDKAEIDKLLSGSDVQLAAAGARAAQGPFVFLGEESLMTDHGIMFRNAPKVVEKCKAIHKLLQTHHTMPIRQIFAIFGIVFWGIHTLNIGLWERDPNLLLRCASALGSQADVFGWDHPASLHRNVIDALIRMLEVLETNEAKAPADYLRPSTADWNDYQTLIVVDASKVGWAANIHNNGTVTQVAAGWSIPLGASAEAEPLAATLAFKWAKKKLGELGNVAIVTDHQPIATAQRQWQSGYGGTGRGRALAGFYETFYSGDIASTQSKRDVFYIPGEANPVDAASRAVRLHTPLNEVEVSAIAPPASSCWHPFGESRASNHG